MKYHEKLQNNAAIKVQSAQRARRDYDIVMKMREMDAEERLEFLTQRRIRGVETEKARIEIQREELDAEY